MQEQSVTAITSTLQVKFRSDKIHQFPFENLKNLPLHENDFSLCCNRQTISFPAVVLESVTLINRVIESTPPTIVKIINAKNE